jgi:aminoglycoside 3-N-acetyltransferase
MSSEAAVAHMLDAAGVPKEAALFVHAGFRGLARAGHAPDAFVRALAERVRDGTLLMPAMSWRIATPANPVFDARTTPGHVGILAECFRTGLATHRSVHPTHSVAACGRDAWIATDGHHLDATPCGPNSPHARLRGRNAHVLMLGCDLAACTAMHHAEETVAPARYLEDAIETYECRDLQGRSLTVSLRRHRRVARDFQAFAAPLLAAGDARAGTSDGVTWFAVPLDAMLGRVLVALRADPDATLAGRKLPIASESG